MTIFKPSAFPDNITINYTAQNRLQVTGTLTPFGVVSLPALIFNNELINITATATIQAAGAVGPNLSAGVTYGYVITAIDNSGAETYQTVQTLAVTEGATAYPIIVSWTPVTSAVSYNVYKTSSSPFYIESLTKNVLATSYTDSGNDVSNTGINPPLFIIDTNQWGLYMRGGNLIMNSNSSSQQFSIQDGLPAENIFTVDGATKAIEFPFNLQLGYNGNAIGSGVGGHLNAGSGSPNGTVSGVRGDFWFRTNGGAGTSIYVCTGTTNWTAIA